jgi:hypothetical protein
MPIYVNEVLLKEEQDEMLRQGNCLLVEGNRKNMLEAMNIKKTGIVT